MKRYMLMTLVITMSYVAIGGGEARAQGFYDSCPRDFWYEAPYYDGRTLGVGHLAVHIGRPSCPWLIIDITDAQDMAIRFSGEWAYFQPLSAAECNGATYTYVVARYEGVPHSKWSTHCNTATQEDVQAMKLNQLKKEATNKCRKSGIPS